MKHRNFMPGSLRRHSLSEENRYNLLTLLADKYSNNTFDIIGNIFEDQFMLFMDMFAGDTITVPTRQEVDRMIREVKAYQHALSSGMTTAAKEDACKKYSIDMDSLDKCISVCK